MMRKFVHKTLWWIAEEKTSGDYRIYKQHAMWLEKNIMDWVHHSLFIDSQDREEVIEKDWITFLFENLDHWYKYEDFRERVLKYAPKQKKFTRDEVCKWSNKAYFDWAEERYLIDFLKEHNLLSKDTQWETSE